MLGLFWFWATELIDNNDEPNGTTVAQQTQTAAPSPTNGGGSGNEPELTEETGSGDGDPTATSDAPRATRTPRGGAEEEPTEETEPVGQFVKDDIVVTNTEANLRSSPRIVDGNIVTTLPDGTELTVTGDSVEADDYIWVPVEDNGTGELKGYVAEDVLDPA
jgi:hypothetical protein